MSNGYFHMAGMILVAAALQSVVQMALLPFGEVDPGWTNFLFWYLTAHLVAAAALGIAGAVAQRRERRKRESMTPQARLMQDLVRASVERAVRK